jgi:CRISPR-associated protein Csb2
MKFGEPKRLSKPPAPQWVSYARRRDCFKTEPAQRVSSRSAPKIQVARFSLRSTELPLVTETLPVAESVRRICMGIYGRTFAASDGTRARSAIFSGKDADSLPLQGHGHAYYLPTDEDNDGRLDHLTVAALDGFGANELLVLQRLHELKRLDREQSRHLLRVLLLGLGRLDDCQALPTRVSQRWISATPFVASRYLKKRGTKRDPVQLWDSPHHFLIAVLREELERLIDRRPAWSGLPLCDIKIEPIVDQNGAFRRCGGNLRPIQFKRFRQKRGDDGGNRPAGFFRIDFGRKVSGPIALGHSCHFGIGLFVPVR